MHQYHDANANESEERNEEPEERILRAEQEVVSRVVGDGISGVLTSPAD